MPLVCCFSSDYLWVSFTTTVMFSFVNWDAQGEKVNKLTLCKVFPFSLHFYSLMYCIWDVRWSLSFEHVSLFNTRVSFLCAHTSKRVKDTWQLFWVCWCISTVVLQDLYQCQLTWNGFLKKQMKMCSHSWIFIFSPAQTGYNDSRWRMKIYRRDLSFPALSFSHR